MAKDEKAEQAQAAADATKSAELAHSHIQRFLDLQAERNANLIMVAHEQKIDQAAKAAGAAAGLASINIQRFLELQAGREASLIMRAHQADADVEKGRKG